MSTLLKTKAVSKIKDAVRRGIPLNKETQKLKTSMAAFNKNGLKQLQAEIKDLSAEEIQRFFRDYKAIKTLKHQRTNQLISQLEPQISQKALDDAIKEIIKEDTASTTISSVSRGHKGRKEHNYIYNYPQPALKRQLEVSNTEFNTQPSTNLQSVPRTSYLRNVNTKKVILKTNMKKLYQNIQY
jgi:hypothetical protein